MMDKSELKKLIEKTTEERLREIVNDWIENNDDFRSFVEQKLNPPIDEIDFDAELAKALMHEANLCVARRGPEMSQNLRYPDVALKYYNELLESERWDDAIALLDKAQGLRQDESNRWLTYGPSPDWLAMKQQLLMEHGSISARIENLKALFHHTYDEEKRWQYYEMLRNMIPDNEWKDFYTNLLRSETGYGVLDKIAPFLIKEGEYEWLYRLIAENEIKDKTDYRTPLKYSSVLIGEYDGEMRAMMVRTFRNYAADRFGYKKKVKTGKYSYFCEDLAKLADFGMDEELQELVTYFKDEYKTRPSLMTELRKIKTK